MIANAGAMGLDWRVLSLSAYMEALEAQNEMQTGGDKTAPVISDKFKNFMAAHTIQ